jgi:hypothetical protein
VEIKDKDSGAVVARAELVLEGEQDVELLRRALEAYERHVKDKSAPFVIPLPLPGSRQ